MNTQRFFVLLITMILMASPLALLTPYAGAETWTQTTDSDFQEGELFFVNNESGALKLSQTLTESWVVVGEGSSDFLGIGLASAGDVNGDGYDDVIVGAYYDASQTGQAYVFHGSANGIPAVDDAGDAHWSQAGTATGDEYGRCVASAGDVNGDGYDDVIVGSPGWSSSKGKAYLYYGSPTGLSTSSDWNYEGTTADQRMGWAVACAGDVNSDGYDDLIIGSPGHNSNRGYAYLFHGASSGPESSPDWSKAGYSSGSYMAFCVSSGDVNGDGYSDILVSAPGYSSSKGSVYSWFGSSSGLDSGDYDVVISGKSSYDRFGGQTLLTDTSSRSQGLRSAGDVNGDGYDDIIVGAYQNDDSGSNAGKAYLFLGSSGLSGAVSADDADWTAVAESGDSYFGISVASVGDVNNDGYDDVMASCHVNGDMANNAGKAYLWLGSASGPGPDPSWTELGESSYDYYATSLAGAGDVNRDGYADVLVGAYGNDDGASSSGKAYLYSYGLPAVFSSEEDWSELGEVRNDYFGKCVASAGDVNGDGYDDVIIGAHYNDDGGTSAGKAYVYHGSSSGLSTSPAWSKQGEESSDRLGTSVAAAGDVNGDGYDDVIIGAYLNDGAGSNAGEVYVYHGSSSGLSTSLAWSEQGEHIDDYFGYSVASAGDVNGDGYDDVIVGAHRNDDGGVAAGKAYVYFGSSSGITSTVPWSKQGETAGDQFGAAVAAAGDLNGDGYDDVIIGAPTNDDGGSEAGEAYAYHGSPTGISSELAWSEQGESANDQFGTSVASAGDVNGDGYDDVIIGAPYNDDGGSEAGEVYAYHGSSSGLSSWADWSDQGEAASSEFGYSVASAEDVNGDGYDDVVVGAYSYDSSAGRIYVYHGSSSGLPATPGWWDQGEAAMDYFGQSVASAGDVNHDGYSDVIVGAHYNDDAGKAYVYHGSGYAQQGIYDSNVFDIDGTEGVDWFKLSWGPVSQPAGTSIKAQIATNDGGSSWSWKGPDGTSSSYYTKAAGQDIYSGDRGKYLRVRFYLETEFVKGGDGQGFGETIRTPSITDFSVSYGKFTKPTATLNWPNGGENLMHAETYDVTWETTGDLSSDSPVSLYYRLDGGSWTSIVTGTENDGEYRWTLPSNENVERALVKVVASAVDGSTVSDTSDMTFSIDPPPVNPETGDRIISPAAAQELEVGSTVVVEWQLAGEETVSLYSSSNFGQSWDPVVEDILNLGSYHWILPDDMTSEHVVIKVQGAEQEVVSNLFIINEEGTGAQEEVGSEDSSGNSVIVEGLAALIIGVLVILALVVREKPKK